MPNLYINQTNKHTNKHILRRWHVTLLKLVEPLDAWRSLFFTIPTCHWQLYKCSIYCATVLTVLQYGAVMWAMKAQHLKCLNALHNHCIRTIFKVTRHQHWRTSGSFRQLLVLLEWRSQWPHPYGPWFLPFGSHGTMQYKCLTSCYYGKPENRRPCQMAQKWLWNIASDIGYRDH